MKPTSSPYKDPKTGRFVSASKIQHSFPISSSKDPQTGRFVSHSKGKSLFIPKKSLIALGLVLILGLVVAPSYYFYSQYNKARQQLENPNINVGDDKKEILTHLGQLMVLPEGEEPTIATVSDKEKLRQQPFFSKAENGDKAIFYYQAKKVILYRPSINKVIEVTSINLAAPPTGSLTSTPSVSP